MARTIGYIRVSTDDQADNGLSLRTQEESIRRYCELHELGDPSIVADAGLSAATMDRPGLQSIIEAVMCGDVDHVVVTSLDRLSRSTRDVLTLVVDTFDHRCGFHSVKQQLDTSTAMGRFVLTQWAALAELERGLISERTSEVLRGKKIRGERLGRNPFGFLPGPGELVPDPDTMPIALEIVRRRRAGETLREIRQDLTERGIPSPKGGEWSDSTVMRIANNRAYDGIR